MSINLTTYLTGKDVTPTEDAIVYEYATNDDGIIYGCDVSVKTDNKIFVDGGHGIFRGRKFTVLEETISVPLSPSGTKKKKLIIRMDLANQANPIQFLIVDSGYKLTQQTNLNLTNGVWELELATMSVTNTAVTNLKQTFTVLKRGKPTVTVDDVVGLDTEITKLEEFDKKISGDVTKLKTDKADKSVAQMFKLTQDNGYAIALSDGDFNELKDPGNYFVSNFKHAPSSSDGFFVIVTKSNQYMTHQLAISGDANTGKVYSRYNRNTVWYDWVELATTDQAQMHKLTQDDGYSLRGENDCNNLTKNGDYYLVGGQIKNGPPVRNVGSFVRVIAKDSNNLTQFFTVNSRSFYYHGFRNCDGGVWTPWQKLGGIDAKVYDIVMLGGLKPYKNAKELDNKIVVYNGVAHLDLNVDEKSIISTSRITIPKELAVRVKPESSLYDERAYLTAITTMGHYHSEEEYSVNHNTPESTNPTVALYFDIDNGMSSATTLKVKKGIFDNVGNAENRIAHVSWYVGGAK